MSSDFKYYSSFVPYEYFNSRLDILVSSRCFRHLEYICAVIQEVNSHRAQKIAMVWERYFIQEAGRIRPVQKQNINNNHQSFGISQQISNTQL